MATPMTDPARAEARERLAMLAGFLGQDPSNIELRTDTAEAALDAGDPARAASILREAPADVPPRAANLAGLAALRLGRFKEAADAFGSLVDGGEDAPGLRFNLAWARTRLGDLEGALALLDPAVTRLPQAAMLEVQVLHAAGRLDEAVEKARIHLAMHPDDAGLNAVVSVLAVDVEDPDLAAATAARAGDHPDALATLGTLALGEDRASNALDYFDRALDANRHSPRAWIGRGLARLMTGAQDRAPADIDRGAELFGTHVGSWIAAGWAHYVAGDRRAARARFETALALDPTFAETHGGLAVIDIADGRLADAAERTKVALRLDRECFGAALARSLLTTADGDPARGAAILQRAMNTPLDASGRTIAQSLARMGLG